MKTQLYAIYDTASGTYQKPVFARADGEVTREFQSLCTDAESPYGQHPEDYSLFRLAIFDDLTGKITDEKNECLATGLELVALSRNVNRDNIEALDLKLSPGGTA
jgi:hypothetical protein